jgi:hypothetical protein
MIRNNVRVKVNVSVRINVRVSVWVRVTVKIWVRVSFRIKNCRCALYWYHSNPNS